MNELVTRCQVIPSDHTTCLCCQQRPDLKWFELRRILQLYLAACLEDWMAVLRWCLEVLLVSIKFGKAVVELLEAAVSACTHVLTSSCEGAWSRNFFLSL